MPDETPHRPAEIRDARGGDKGGAGAESPLQTRAAFLANWDWESVVGHNRGMCARGGAQHGANSESIGAVAQDWQRRREVESSFAEALDFLRSCHRRAPFLFSQRQHFRRHRAHHCRLPVCGIAAPPAAAGDLGDRPLRGGCARWGSDVGNAHRALCGGRFRSGPAGEDAARFVARRHYAGAGRWPGGCARGGACERAFLPAGKSAARRLMP